MLDNQPKLSGRKYRWGNHRGEKVDAVFMGRMSNELFLIHLFS